MKKEVRLRCTGVATLSISDIKPIQGSLKILTEANFKRFRREIEQDGFIEPLSVWEHPKNGEIFVLNGHQRLETLRRMRQDGWVIPQLPVNFIEADDLNHAKKLVLAMASQYGTVDPHGLYEFASSVGVSVEQIREQYAFADFDIDRFVKEFTSSEEPIPDYSIPAENIVIGENSEHLPEPLAPKKSTEVNPEDFEEFDHVCPRCKFEFNAK